MGEGAIERPRLASKRFGFLADGCARFGLDLRNALRVFRFLVGHTCGVACVPEKKYERYEAEAEEHNTDQPPRKPERGGD